MATQDHIAVGSTTFNTSTGSQDLTIAGLGWTPVAAIFIVTNTNTEDADDAFLSFGMAMADDSGNSAGLWVGSDDNTGNSDTRHWHDTTNGTWIKRFPATGGANTEATIDSDDATAGPISNGWRIDVTDAPASAWQVQFIFFGGTGLSASVETLTMGANVTDTATVTPGFETNLMLTMNAGRSSDSSSAQQHNRLSLGAMSYDGTTIRQACTGHIDIDNKGTTETAGQLDSDRIAMELDTTPSQAWSGEVTAVSSTAVTVTTRDGSSGSDLVSCLCVNLPSGDEAYVSVENSPTSAASDWVVSGLGITPDFVGLFTTNLTATDTLATDSTAYAVSLGFYDGTTEKQTFMRTEDAQATSDSSTRVSSQWVDTFADDGSTQYHDINLSSSPFESGGWTVPSAAIATANGTARKWISWAVGAAASADVEVTTNTNAYTFTTYGATITPGVEVTTNANAYTFTTYPATIEVGGDVEVTTNENAYTFATYQATITPGVEVTTNLDAFTFTTYPATIEGGGVSVAEDGYLPSIKSTDSPAVKARKRNARYRYFLTH